LQTGPQFKEVSIYLRIDSRCESGKNYLHPFLREAAFNGIQALTARLSGRFNMYSHDVNTVGHLGNQNPIQAFVKSLGRQEEYKRLH